jgi:hypothetical protein
LSTCWVLVLSQLPMPHGSLCVAASRILCTRPAFHWVHSDSTLWPEHSPARGSHTLTFCTKSLRGTGCRVLQARHHALSLSLSLSPTHTHTRGPAWSGICRPRLAGHWSRAHLRQWTRQPCRHGTPVLSSTV